MFGALLHMDDVDDTLRGRRRKKKAGFVGSLMGRDPNELDNDDEVAVRRRKKGRKRKPRRREPRRERRRRGVAARIADDAWEGTFLSSLSPPDLCDSERPSTLNDDETRPRD